MPRHFLEDNRRLLVKPKGSRGTTISALPNDVMGKILSNLSTKDSIRTSTLARGWRNLWSHAPALDLNTGDFRDDDDFWEFFGKFLESSRGQELKRFKLVYNIAEHVHSDFVGWIDAVLIRRVCHMTIQNQVDGEEDLVRMPLSIYASETLVNMTVFGIVFDAIESNFIFLPSLKTMHLEDVKFDGERLMTTFISRCPVLEELVIVTCHNDFLGVVGVHSRSLKRFTLVSKRGEVFEDFEDDRPNDPDVEVNAPRLEHMVISDYQCENFVVHLIAPYAKVKVDVIFNGEYGDPPESSVVRNFLTGISTVDRITISARTLEVIHNYCELMEPLPQFSNLSLLHASFEDTLWEILPTFLESCPNLHSLVLEFDCLPETEQVDLSSVPQCFQSSLEFVHLKTTYAVNRQNEVTGTSSKMKLAKYFLEHGAALKKLRLSASFHNIIVKIISIPRISTRCQVVRD